MELSSAEMDGDSCCFTSATSPFFLLRFLLLQSPFSFSHLNYFCQIILRFLLFHPPSFFLSPFPSLPFFPLYFLTLILLWALVNSDWFARHSLFDFPSFVSLTAFFSSTVWTHCRKWSSHFCSSLQLCFCSQDIHRDWLARAIAHTYTQDSRTSSRHTDENVVHSSPLPIHGSENLLKATRCSHTVALSFNTCFGFFGALHCPLVPGYSVG